VGLFGYPACGNDHQRRVLMTVEFTIDGLNAQQQVLADIIWAFEDFSGVQKFIKTLPTGALRDEAYSIVELMKMAAVEQCYEGIAEPFDAQALLAKISKRKG
jgi:hypothetical protein